MYQSVITGGFTPICVVVNSRPFFVSRVASLLLRGMLRRSRQSFGRVVVCKTSASTTSVVGTTHHFPVVSGCRLIIIQRTRLVHSVRLLSGCIGGPLVSAILIVGCGCGGLSHHGTLTSTASGAKILFRSGGVPSCGVPTFVTSFVRVHSVKVSKGTSRVLSSFLKGSLDHLDGRLSGLTLVLPRGNTGHVAPRLIRRGVKVDGRCGGFRLVGTLTVGSILGTGHVTRCFRGGPGDGPVRVALPMLFGCFSGLLVYCCAGSHSRTNLVATLKLQKAFRIGSCLLKVQGCSTVGIFGLVDSVHVASTHSGKIRGASISSTRLLGRLLCGVLRWAIFCA